MPASSGLRLKTSVETDVAGIAYRNECRKLVRNPENQYSCSIVWCQACVRHRSSHRCCARWIQYRMKSTTTIARPMRT